MAQYINNKGEYYDGISVVIGNTRYISPNEELIILAGYYKVEEALPDPFELAKIDKLNEINTYDLSANVNIFYINGIPMWLDALTRLTLRISIESYQSIGALTVTKWFDGLSFTFPTELWLAMLNALEIYAAEALNVTESHRANVRALDDIEEILEYDYTAGYPEVLNLTSQGLQTYL